ncbi:MAG: FIST N-terminal domain-containing protein [Candidatus Omnitrophota bacterium]
MKFINRISEAQDQEQMLKDLAGDISGFFDLAILFITPWSTNDPVELYQDLAKRLSIKNFLCCTSAGIIGSEREIEGRPAASLLLAKLPGVTINTFYLNQAQLDGLKESVDLYNFFEIYPNEAPNFLVLPDPFAFDTNRFLKILNQAYKGTAVIGGLASAASSPQENFLIVNGLDYKEGIIGAVLNGAVKIDTVVSQGCRPVGETYIITKAQGNIIYELAGRPFYKVLEDVLKAGTDYDRLLAREAISIGIVINEYQEQFKHGDFLIRPVMAIDPKNGAGAIGDYITVGQTVQFHLRDAKTANEDLHELLKQQKMKNVQTPQGALVFSCNGRGIGLFKEHNHDIGIIQAHLGPVPAAGFFCAGEIGPVTGINFLHGFTNSMALFYAK